MKSAFIGTLFFLPAIAFAASIPSFGPIIEIEAIPQYPEPGASVTLKAHGAESNLGAAYIWTVNGTVVSQGAGDSTLTTNAGAAGSVTTVTVTVSADNGAPIGSATMTLEPAVIDVVWEGKTYVPPFYQGRPLPNTASPTIILAIPHITENGAAVPADSLIYRWEINSKVQQAQSGYGKSSIEALSPRLTAPFEVLVRATTKDGAVTAEKRVIVTPVNPRTLVYEKAPLLGTLFNHLVVGTFPFKKNEVSFEAFPLFVENPDSLSYSWTLDGKPFTLNADVPREATFRKTGEGGGTFSVSFSFESATKIFEQAAQTFTLAL